MDVLLTPCIYCISVVKNHIHIYFHSHTHIFTGTCTHTARNAVWQLAVTTYYQFICGQSRHLEQPGHYWVIPRSPQWLRTTPITSGLSISFFLFPSACLSLFVSHTHTHAQEHVHPRTWPLRNAVSHKLVLLSKNTAFIGRMRMKLSSPPTHSGRNTRTHIFALTPSLMVGQSTLTHSLLLQTRSHPHPSGLLPHHGHQWAYSEIINTDAPISWLNLVLWWFVHDIPI